MNYEFRRNDMNKIKKNERKQPLSKKLNFSEVKAMNQKYELDNIDDLWYFVKSKKNRWIMGSAH